MTTTATLPTTSRVHLIGRAEYKSGLVLYRVRTDGGEHIHDVTWDGTKVTACVTPDGPCQSFFYRHTCSHSRYVRGLEEARMEREAFDTKVQADKAAWEAEAARYQAEKKAREEAAYEARMALKAREQEREQWNEFQFQCGAYDHYWN